MDHTSIDDVGIQNNPLGVHSERRPVSDALDTSDFAMNFFRLQPGESFSGGLHTHHDQEEVFYVEEGEATFTVGRDGDTEAVVSGGELIRFEPGEFQQGTNTGDDELVGWALGAPKSKHDWDEIESIVYCQECEEETGHGLSLTDAGRFELTCMECDNSFTS
ncbi:cupin domain-containing protein [Halosegnis rubeus]|uniref:Cupin domain-containing protein n=1 Tax=Halosegnis rubeus TaxID=2212850 RepID=A0A5N5UHM0_9EURY|nr:cupin domain-containing protein [Halosegnis rubeus]KAB7514876.1 cupin domain-containing protein [Halosegnis rubeus]KAB7518185.1 cupin domain-containing protein [Halosegnis rubeus]